ncbi:hypothetical protein PRO82_000854 [Candidatus Protochlamydia amoebophila]|nr:hypothetical protein [Candidatus Protochlamydia amoebophila]
MSGISVAGLFNLRNIFYLIIDRFNNSSFPKKNFVCQLHQLCILFDL